MLDQKKDGRIKLGYQFGGGASFVMPSEKTLQIIPDAYDSLEAKKKYIETWAKEFIATMKNPSGYYKATPPPTLFLTIASCPSQWTHCGCQVVGKADVEPWDFDTLMDYVFSFWVLKAVPADHPRVAVWAQPGCIRTIL